MLSTDRQHGISMGLAEGILLALALMGFCWGSIGCMASDSTSFKAKKDIASAYAQDVEPLETYRCGQCHYYFYNRLRNEGGKHRISCRQCHEAFHIYRPGKIAYEDILPKCESCHEQIHGTGLAQCAACHQAHAPMDLPASRALEQGCHVCHPDPDREMKTFVSQHTELYCYTCHHTRHRHVPECMECHQPHARGMTESECMACHPPHKALQVVYPEDIAQEACAGCHRQAYDILQESDAKHTMLSCARCHSEHRAIKQCQECHPDPHEATMLQRFPTCGECHGVAHNLL